MEDPDLILYKFVLIKNTLKFCQKAFHKILRNDAKVVEFDAVFNDSEEEIEKNHQQMDKTVVGLSRPIIG